MSTPSTTTTAAREERMTQSFSPDSFYTPHPTRHGPLSPPSVSRNKRKNCKSYYTDDYGDQIHLSRFFDPSCLDEVFEEKSESKSFYRGDLRQRLSPPDFYDSLYLSDVSSESSRSSCAPLTPRMTLRSTSKHTPSRRLISPIRTRQGKMSRRNSGNALAA